MEGALRQLRMEQKVRSESAKRRLGRLMAARGPSRLKRVTLHLEEQQVEACKLLAEISGGTYQERLRDWVEAALRAEWKALRRG